MLTLASPLWLLALIALPLLWWLHRWRESGRRFPVAAGFLWQEASANAEQGRLLSRPDPLWLLRALFAGLLVLALANPRCSEQRLPSVTIWLDDSPSMFAVAKGSSRMEQAMAALEVQLGAEKYAAVILRSLGLSGHMQRFEGDQWRGSLRAFSPAPRGEPQLPPPALLAAATQHWLVTDGASPGVAGWAGRAPLARHLQVGAERENAAVTNLALRRDGAGGPGAQVSVSVKNGGELVADRVLSLFAGDLLLDSWPLTVPPGASLVRHTQLERVPAAALRARLTPGDALALDDELSLGAAALRPVRVALSGNCGAPLRAALAAYPALALSDTGFQPAGLAVHCGAAAAREASQQPFAAVPTIVLPAHGEGVLPLRGELRWHSGAGPLRELVLLPAWLLAANTSDIPTAAGDTVLLSSGQRPLITHDRAARLLRVDFDLAGLALVRRPEFPLLLAGLVEHLLAPASAADGIVSTHSVSAVAIAPLPLPAAVLPAGDMGQLAARSLAPPLIIAALAVLAVDAALLLWRRRRYPDEQVRG